MWTVTLTAQDGRTVTASAVTRSDARTWARQYATATDTVTITPPRKDAR